MRIPSIAASKISLTTTAASGSTASLCVECQIVSGIQGKSFTLKDTGSGGGSLSVKPDLDQRLLLPDHKEQGLQRNRQK